MRTSTTRTASLTHMMRDLESQRDHRHPPLYTSFGPSITVTNAGKDRSAPGADSRCAISNRSGITDICRSSVTSSRRSP
eukprot:532565-Alexandrium_andersonii.AAC.1